MRGTRYLDPVDVPPKPDPVTGLPAPPRAPGATARSAADPEGVADGPPPDGQEPVLAAFGCSRRAALLFAAGVTVASVLVVTIVAGFSMAWAGEWPVWAILAGLAAVTYLIRRRSAMSAGAEWVQIRGRKWVRTYELTEVIGLPLGELDQRSADRSGRAPGNRQRPRPDAGSPVRDLVYNGIVHSVIVGGARTNALLHRVRRAAAEARRRAVAGPGVSWQR